MTETNTTLTKDEAFKFTNALVELSAMLSAGLWCEDASINRYALAALADSAKLAANELHDLVQAL